MVLTDFFHQVDWKLLRQQKACLLAVMDKYVDEPDVTQSLQGLLNFVDSIQDEAAEEFPADVIFGPSKNKNCLEGIQCPDCGHEDAFQIEMQALINITDDGTDPHEDTEWDGMSYIMCGRCNHQGKVWQFKA